MQVSSTDLIAAVRGVIDADEVAPGKWASDSLLLSWLNHGVVRLWRKAAMAGRIMPSILSTTPGTTGTITIGGDPVAFPNDDTVTEPLVIFGVAEQMSQGPRPLRLANAGFGPVPYPFQSMTGSTAQVWWVTRGPTAGQYIINLGPSVTSGNYVVTWLAKPAQLVTANPDPGQATELDIPAGLEMYPVLYAARMANTRGGAAPPSVQRQLDEMDSELTFAAELLLQGNAPRVINTDYERRGWFRRGQDKIAHYGQFDSWWAP